jgi:hypothetical protein
MTSSPDVRGSRTVLIGQAVLDAEDVLPNGPFGGDHAVPEIKATNSSAALGSLRWQRRTSISQRIRSASDIIGLLSRSGTQDRMRERPCRFNALQSAGLPAKEEIKAGA